MRASNLEAIINILDLHKPNIIVELGSGISTLYTAAWLSQEGSGSLITFENDKLWGETIRRYITLHHLNNFSEVYIAPLKPCTAFGYDLFWYDLDKEIEQITGIDLLIVDGPPADSPDSKLIRMPALEKFYHQLSEDAIVFLDDGIRPGEKKIAENWRHSYPEFQSTYFNTLSGYWIFQRKSHHPVVNLTTQK